MPNNLADLQLRLSKLERELRALAEEAWRSGHRVLVNTHQGVIEFHNPQYPPLSAALRLDPISVKVDEEDLEFVGEGPAILRATLKREEKVKVWKVKKGSDIVVQVAHRYHNIEAYLIDWLPR